MMQRAPDAVKTKLAESIPFPNRMGEPSEFAELCLHIATNSFLNGETIRLDGAVRMAAL